MPCVGVGVPHDSAKNWRRVDDLDLGALPFGGAAAYSAKFASLDKLDELVALAQCRPVFIAEVMSCFYGRFGQRAIGEPCEILDQFVILEVRQLAMQVDDFAHWRISISASVGCRLPHDAD